MKVKEECHAGRKNNSLYISRPALVSCAGNSADELFASCLECRQDGIISIGALNNKNYLSGRLKNIEPPEGAETYNPGASRICRAVNAALSSMAADIKELVQHYGRENIAVCIGSCDNGSCISPAAHKEFFTNGAFPPLYKLYYQSAQFISQYIAKYTELEGPVLTVETACASSAGAVVRACELIRAGFCTAALVGGVDVSSDIVLIGFDSLEAVSPNICNPFSINRSGITLGEAAVFFILSPDDISQNNITLAGAGESADAEHITAPAKDGSGAERAMRAALKSANMNACDIDYINLHGTGTILNDRSEALALSRVFESVPPASSTKPVTGHTLGAAGALELAVCYETLLQSNKEKFMPVHIFDGEYDTSLPPIPLVKKGERAKRLNICMSNSFAFGGCNTSLIIRRDL